jgi:hypothetical protein
LVSILNENENRILKIKECLNLMFTKLL